MKAIKTSYHGPTNTKGSRIIASDSLGNRVTVPVDYSLDTEAMHMEAAKMLCQKMAWQGKIQGGWFDDDMFWVFVN